MQSITKPRCSRQNLQSQVSRLICCLVSRVYIFHKAKMAGVSQSVDSSFPGPFSQIKVLNDYAIVGRIPHAIYINWYVLSGKYSHTLWSHDHLVCLFDCLVCLFEKRYTRWLEFIHNIVPTWTSVFSCLNISLYL